MAAAETVRRLVAAHERDNQTLCILPTRRPFSRTQAGRFPACGWLWNENTGLTRARGAQCGQGQWPAAAAAAAHWVKVGEVPCETVSVRPYSTHLCLAGCQMKSTVKTCRAARQRRCSSPRRQRKHKAKAVSHPPAPACTPRCSPAAAGRRTRSSARCAPSRAQPARVRAVSRLFSLSESVQKRQCGGDPSMSQAARMWATKGRGVRSGGSDRRRDAAEGPEGAGVGAHHLVLRRDLGRVQHEVIRELHPIHPAELERDRQPSAGVVLEQRDPEAGGLPERVVRVVQRGRVPRRPRIGHFCGGGGGGGGLRFRSQLELCFVLLRLARLGCGMGASGARRRDRRDRAPHPAPPLRRPRLVCAAGAHRRALARAEFVGNSSSGPLRPAARFGISHDRSDTAADTAAGCTSPALCVHTKEKL